MIRKIIAYSIATALDGYDIISGKWAARLGAGHEATPPNIRYAKAVLSASRRDSRKRIPDSMRGEKE